MAKPIVTDELWEVIEPLLPEEPPKLKGGRPRRSRSSHRHHLPAKERHPLGDAAPRDELWIGITRWVVERTLSWLNRYRQLKVRCERRADVHQAFLDLGCALICWNYIQRFC